MAAHSAEATPLPSSRVMIRGVQGFIIFSLIGTTLGMWWKKPAGLEALVSHLQWQFVAMLLPLLAVDYLIGGLRYRLFFDGKILARVSLWDCMRSNWANIFLGAVTPFQTGGGPAQLYILWRAGAKISDSMLISLINFAATLFFFLASTIAAALLLPANLFGDHFAPVMQTGFVVVVGVTAFVLVVLFFPSIGLTTIKLLFRLAPLRSHKFLSFRDRLLTVLDDETHRFQNAFRQIVRRRTWLLAIVFLATMVLFFNKYVMGYANPRAIGQPVDLGVFIGLQIVQLFLIYFAPTPGASGMAELSAVWLMGKIMPERLLLIYAVLWRLVTTIIGAVIGGGVLLMDMRQLAKPTHADLVTANR